MKPISTYVESELLLDNVALSALQRGLLNLSQYAIEIQPKIEDKRFDSVSTGSIITALSRLAVKYKSTKSINRDLRFDHISLFQDLEEISFDLHSLPLAVMEAIYSAQDARNDFFELTIGKSEITIITSRAFAQHVRLLSQHIQPIMHMQGLIGITFRFDEAYFHEPAVLYNILRVFALEHISIIEFVSTYREATVILSGEDKDSAFQTIRKFFDTPRSIT
jgi:hypothetical protein